VPNTVPPLQIPEFTTDSIDYIAAFNSLIETVNNIDAVIATLRLSHNSLQERASSYTELNDLPAVVNEIVSNPISPSDISLTSLSFAHITTPSYLDKNLQPVIPTFLDIEYPTSTVPKYVFVENGTLQVLPGLLIERVLDTSKFVETTGFLINNNGVLDVVRTIPFGMIYASPSSTGLPPGSVIMWNGDIASSPFMPATSAWTYPAITSWTQSPLQLNNALIPLNTNLVSGTSARNVALTQYTPPFTTVNKSAPISVYVNWFGFDSSVYSTVAFSDARGVGYAPSLFYGDYYGRRCLRIPPFSKMFSYMTNTQHYTNGPSNGLLIEMGLRITAAPSLNSDGTTFMSNLFGIESYEGYGTSVFGMILYVVRNTSGVYTYTLTLYGSVFSAGYANVPIPLTLTELTGGWIDIAIMFQDNKYKVFINKKETLQGTGVPGLHRTDTSKYFYLNHSYWYPTYMPETCTTSRWSADVCVTFDKFFYGVKDIYKIDWNRTDNWIFKSNEAYPALAADREWTPFKGQYPSLQGLYGTTYNTAIDNAAGNVFRLPFDFKGMLLRGRDAGSGMNTNLSLRSNADGYFSRLDTPLLQSHTHSTTLTTNLLKAGAAVISRNYSSNVAGTHPIVHGLDTAVNTTKNLILLDCSTAYKAITKNMSVTYFIVTGL